MHAAPSISPSMDAPSPHSTIRVAALLSCCCGWENKCANDESRDMRDRGAYTGIFVMANRTTKDDFRLYFLSHHEIMVSRSEVAANRLRNTFDRLLSSSRLEYSRSFTTDHTIQLKGFLPIATPGLSIRLRKASLYRGQIPEAGITNIIPRSRSLLFGMIVGGLICHTLHSICQACCVT